VIFLFKMVLRRAWLCGCFFLVWEKNR